MVRIVLKDESGSLAQMRYLIGLLMLVISSAHAAAADAYKLQSGDTIQVSVWQEPKLDRQLKVGPDGRVSLPLAGHIVAGGRTAEEVEKAIAERLASQYQTDLDVTVSLVDQPQTDQAGDSGGEKIIYVMGEVRNPGPLVIKSPTTVLQALAMSGGLGAFASERRIQVHRKIGGRDALLQFDFRKFKRGLNPTGNITLREGDVVIVPENGVLD